MENMTTKSFVSKLIDQLEREGENKNLDIPFMVSVVEQYLENDSEFLKEIAERTYLINGYEEDNSGGYTNGKMRILIEKREEDKKSEYMFDTFENYCYYIEFLFDERYWGYCQCTTDDEGFNLKYNCCGNGCDWSAPSVRITKEINLGGHSWEGSESDYWSYLEEFNLRYYKNKEEKEKQELENHKKSLREEIKMLEQELAELEKITDSEV